jgi:GT2 family glycosyltransferase
MAMSVGAVVVRWRGGDEVRRCLRSLVERGGGSLSRVVLVDSGSGDNGADRLRREFASIEVVALAENRSFAWAAGRGAARCSEPYLLLLNPDCRVPAGSLEELVEFLDGRPHIAGAVPLLISEDGRPQQHWQLRHLPGVARLAAGRVGAPMFPHGPPSDPAPVEQPAAAAWLVRRTVWDTLGGLDPVFEPAWWEDVDFCARLQRHPKLCESVPQGFWVVPEARITHLGGSSLRHLSDAEFLSAYYRNLLRYTRRHNRGAFVFVRASLRLSLLTRALVRPGRRSAYIQTLESLSSN